MQARLLLAILAVLVMAVVGMVGSVGAQVRLTPTPSPLSIPTGDDLAAITREAVTGMRELTADLCPPDHLLRENAVRLPGDFDVNAYFSVLDHLVMEDRYTLDYVYWFEYMRGQPVLYARPVDEEPYATIADFQADYGDNLSLWPSYLDHVVADDTAAGYVQLAVLNVMGGQFYLLWRAAYNDTRIVYDSDSLEAILTVPDGYGPGISPETQGAARALDLVPTVELGEDEARVQLVTFTRWGGFYLWTLTIRRAFPHTLTGEAEELVFYQCGVMF